MHRFVQLGLSVAIAATFVALVAVGINVFVPHPDSVQASMACGDVFAPPPVVREDVTPQEREQQAEKERQVRECQQRVDAERKAFEQKVFAIAVPIGALGVALGALLFPTFLPLGATGMTFGGLLTILYGLLRGLGAVDRRVMFVVVLVAFLGLLSVAWYRGKDLLVTSSARKGS